MEGSGNGEGGGNAESHVLGSRGHNYEDERTTDDGPLLGFQAPQTDLAIIQGRFV